MTLLLEALGASVRRDGGPADEVLTDGALSACFARQLPVRRQAGRWTARSAR